MDVRSADPVFFCNLSNGDAILEFGFQHLAEFDQFITSRRIRFLCFVALFWIVDAGRPCFGLGLKVISFSEIAIIRRSFAISRASKAILLVSGLDICLIFW